MPFTTALMHFDDGFATLYLVNLLATAALTFGLSAYLNTHPDLLLTAPTEAEVRSTRWSSWLLLGGIAVALVASIFLDQNGLWFLLLIPVAQALVNQRGGLKTPPSTESRGEPRASRIPCRPSSRGGNKLLWPGGDEEGGNGVRSTPRRSSGPRSTTSAGSS